MAFVSSPAYKLSCLVDFVSTLDFSERKALITLARSQSIPEAHTSPILFAKVKPILDKLVNHPPFYSLSTDTLSEAGLVIVRLLSSPFTTGLLIVYALGVNLTDQQVEIGRLQSFNKELSATQTRRAPGEWNWSAIISPSLHPRQIIHPLFPSLSPLQRRFSDALPSLFRSYQQRIILPHYTTRGVSSQTSAWLLNRVTKSNCRWGSSRTFHHRIDRRNVRSRDVVHHYIRSGDWPRGLTEMKQAWTPSQLLPRTYFSWGGNAIAASSYLRNFFNDMGDCFSITHRKNRVQPDWLHSRHQSHEGFLFYDLTSFTSWFHEQVPFLRSLADRFRNCTVYLVGEGLTLSQHDLGSLIDAYTDYTTDFADFVVNGSSVGMDYRERIFTHQTAGFLGVPGNLITCTVAHGLAVASMYADEHELQVPGDDVGASYRSTDHRRDVMTCASTLGSLQFEKVFHTPQVSVYLKRLVVDLGDRIQLAPMLIFPLLPFLLNPDSPSHQSNRFRLPDRKILRSRAARVMVSFQRDLWKHTRGEVDDEAYGIILLFLRRIHDQVGLPLSAILQGRLYGSDDPDDDRFPDISVKFAVDDDRCLRWNPDLHFASRYVTRMTIRDTSDVEVERDFTRLEEGSTIVVRNSKGWRFLEDMGWITVNGIPGEKIELTGSDARDAFLFASEPPLREVTVLSDLEHHQLIAAGVVQPPDSQMFVDEEYRPGRFDLNMQSWRYRRYVDLDDVGSAGLYGKSRDWVNDGLASLRSSLSPEPDLDLDY